jgi:hypothetical protein
LAGRSPDTIQQINPALIPDNYAASFIVERQRDQWLVLESSEVAYSCRRLAELAAWAQLNDLSEPALPSGHALQQNLKQIWQALIASPAPVQVFVNSETQTEPAALRRPGFTVVTHHDDPLDFSGSHKLLLRSVDVLRADGIDDWTLESRTDGASVLQCVTELTTTPPTRLAWHAIGGQSRFRIQKRLENLHIQLHAALQESGDRFVFRLAETLSAPLPTMARSRPPATPAKRICGRSYVRHVPDARHSTATAYVCRPSTDSPKTTDDSPDWRCILRRSFFRTNTTCAGSSCSS